MTSALRTQVRPGEYHDSVLLMQAGRELAAQEGVQDAAVVMATEANKSILADAGLLEGAALSAGPNDLVIAVRATSADLADAALQKVEGLLRRRASPAGEGGYTPRTLRAALSLNPQANVAVISVAGRYAAGEAREALQHGLHVLLFSDNVSLEDEIALKTYARDHGLLLMGPGAGTAILNHVALGFANALPPGPVGIISAAGTGLQEVSTLLARRGVGITQAIGTGGRDLKSEVGGIMMLAALEALQQEPGTEVLVLVSKPPDEQVSHRVLRQVAEGGKPAVVCFLGGEVGSLEGLPNVIPARTLQECALLAARAAAPGSPDPETFLEEEGRRLARQAGELRRKLKPGQRCLRGLFSGGTLCYEAQVIWQELLPEPVLSNAPLPGGPALPDPARSQGHCAVDLGAEEFTIGRPHPMIDNDLRIRRMLQEARDPATAVLVLDVVLGYGAHPDPASELGPALVDARDLARREGRELLAVASVTGTEQDPQGLGRTTTALEQAGFIVCDSNAAAARLAGWIVPPMNRGTP